MSKAQSGSRVPGLLAVAVVVTWAAVAHAEEEPIVWGRVTAAGLFKNGLAVIRRELTLPGAGAVQLPDMPEPVHGSFWLESDSPVETRVIMRELDLPLAADAPFDLQRALAGRKVTLGLRDGATPMTGVIEALATTPSAPAASGRPGYAEYAAPYGSAPREGKLNMLVLKTETGRVLIDPSMVTTVKLDGTSDKVRTQRPTMVLQAPKATKPVKVVITYLARGLAWAPSYRAELLDAQTLRLTQAAVIKNELTDLDRTEVQLISGFPNIRFANVTSPLSPRVGWADFFAQLSTRPGPMHAAMQNVATQAVRMRESSPSGNDLPALPTGEGSDIHYQSIGAMSLKVGEAVDVVVASGKGPYRRVVDWLVADSRNADGYPLSRPEEDGDEDADFLDAPWDALRFKNPLPFPMTTAAAVVFDGGQLSGQSMSTFANPGEELSIRVTKALSVRTRAVEHEEEGRGERQALRRGSRDYRKVSVKGELTMKNHRLQKVSMVVRRRFSGELITAEGSPKQSLREEGVYSVNPRRELSWTFDLGANEEKSLSYRYTVLVPD